MDEFVVFAIFVKCAILLGCIYLIYRLFNYAGFSGSMCILVASLYLALGYSMFYT